MFNLSYGERVVTTSILIPYVDAIYGLNTIKNNVEYMIKFVMVPSPLLSQCHIETTDQKRKENQQMQTTKLCNHPRGALTHNILKMLWLWFGPARFNNYDYFFITHKVYIF